MQDQDSRTLDDVLAGERIAMLVTADQRARPMTVIEREGSRLWFVASRDADWVKELPEGEVVAVVISDPGDATFVSLTGATGFTDDRATLERLWSSQMQAWFDGVDDPSLVALHVDVGDGEYWDGPDTLVGRAIRGLVGAVTGQGDRVMGEQGDVTT